MLIRLFRGVIREGAHDRLLRVLHDEVLPSLEAHPGVASATLAVAMDDGGPDEYLLETHWRGIDDLIAFAGAEWRTPRVEPDEEECLLSVSAHHFVIDRVGPPSTAGVVPAFAMLDDVEVDGPGLRVAWNGSAVHLPPREMGALLALASRAGSPIASPELASRIWPGSALVGPYEVRRVIHRLRALLRTSEAPVEIRSLRGLGYVVEPAPSPRSGDKDGTRAGRRRV